MPKKEAPIDHLQSYLPSGTYDPVSHYLHFYKIHLTITRERKSILGDYRHKTHHSNHRISVNGNLNVFAFLVTLLHEIAHLLTFEKFDNRVQTHGKEWKMIYTLLLEQFLKNKTFPSDIESALLQSLQNPAASSCAEDGLVRVLRNYDKKVNGCRFIEEIPHHALFKTTDGRIYQKGNKLRKRFSCKEVKTGREYLFSPVYEVELI